MHKELGIIKSVEFGYDYDIEMVGLRYTVQVLSGEFCGFMKYEEVIKNLIEIGLSDITKLVGYPCEVTENNGLRIMTKVIEK